MRPRLPSPRRALARSLALGALGLTAFASAGCYGPCVGRHVVEPLAVGGRPGAPAETLNLLVCRPRGYDDPGRQDERWPLVVFLHGIFAEGREPSSVTRSGLPSLLERGLEVDALVASPQMPQGGRRFGAEHVRAVLEHMARRYRVDERCVVLTGVSLGGDAGWDVLAALPGRFSAFVPVAAPGHPGLAARLRDVRLWAFHGTLDPFVPFPLARAGVRARRAAGGEARLTLLPWGFHWVAPQAYVRPDLWAWALAPRPATEPPGPHSGKGPPPVRKSCR